MENNREVRYEQENLLDKFINNEKKAKFWAAISLLAFFAVATTVIVVAYKIKNGKEDSKIATTTVATEEIPKSEQGKSPEIKPKYETKPGSETSKPPDKKDAKDEKKINELLTRIEILESHLRDTVTLYTSVSQDLANTIRLLEACNKKIVDPPPPDIISVVIYTLKMPDTSVAKLNKIIGGRKKDRFKISIQPANKESKPCIRYADPKNQKAAEILSNFLNNNSNSFRNWNKLVVIPGNPEVMKTDIEVWLGVVY